MGVNDIQTRALEARASGTVRVRIVAILIPLFLIAPALWNGYPLLQWDTGGYLARWLMVAMFGHALSKRLFDDLALLAATVSFALLGNALICGVISGPHDRYGARLVWIATLTVLLAVFSYFGDDEEEELIVDA